MHVSTLTKGAFLTILSELQFYPSPTKKLSTPMNLAKNFPPYGRAEKEEGSGSELLQIITDPDPGSPKERIRDTRGPRFFALARTMRKKSAGKQTKAKAPSRKEKSANSFTFCSLCCTTVETQFHSPKLLAVLFYLSRLALPLAFPFLLSYSGRPVLAVPFWPSRSGCLCSGCPVLAVQF